LARAFVGLDFEAAIEWLETLPESEKTKARGAAAEVVSPSQAHILIEGAPQGPERLALLTKYSEKHLNLNTAKWMVEMPEIETPELRAVLRAALPSLAQGAPLALLDWSPTIQYEDIRAEAYLSVAKEWSKADPSRSRRILKEAELPEDLRQAVVEHLELFIEGKEAEAAR
jgi:hypothetical protein